jgi:hypothetical protein
MLLIWLIRREWLDAGVAGLRSVLYSFHDAIGLPITMPMSSLPEAKVSRLWAMRETRSSDAGCLVLEVASNGRRTNSGLFHFLSNLTFATQTTCVSLLIPRLS